MIDSVGALLPLQVSARGTSPGALDALAGYGADAFLTVFYQHLGRSYLQPHEAGLRTLFEAARSQIPPILKRAVEARKAFETTT